jgi:NitT/TauT family transport system ATP-binding protein
LEHAVGHVTIENVYKTYERESASQFVLRGIHLEIGRGEFCSILGPTGCGKTTLLNLIAGYIKPDRGRILVDGEPVRGPGFDRGVVFQEYALFPWYTVLENVMFGPEVRGLGRPEALQRARRYLDLVGLGDQASKFPDELSGGMKQRVAIARALANEPGVLLMDEPFGALDALTREVMRQELLRIWLKVRPTVIFVTHSIPEAVSLSDRVAVMTPGGVLERTVDITAPRPRDPRSSEYLDVVNVLHDALVRDEVGAGLRGSRGPA